MQVDMERLPHWSRVAFAARCARRVQPLFAEAWPNTTELRKMTVEHAIALAERSVAEQQPSDKLKWAFLEATMTAGQAIMPHHYPALDEDEDDEPGPTNSETAVVASLVAKVAENAARAAAASPDQSARPATDAFHFALNAIYAAGRPGLVELLEADFEAAVASAPRRPWWRFW